MSNLTIALIVIAVYAVLCSVAMAVAWYGLKDEPAIYLTKEGWHRNGFKERTTFENILKVVFAVFPLTLSLISSLWQYAAMIAIVVFLLSQLTGCAVNVVVIPDATIQYGSAIDQHVDQSQVAQGQ